MDKRMLLVATIVIVLAIAMVYFLMFQPSDGSKIDFTKQYSNEACSQTAIQCVQEKLRNDSFDCTHICSGSCSPEMIKECM